MKAITIAAYGGQEVLQLTEQPEPVIRPDQLLIKVHAASVNPIDWRIRSGGLQRFISCEFPVILGREVAGVVVQVGSNVTGFAPGDEVFGFLQQQEMKWGGYAELVPADAVKMAHKPKGLSYEQAVAIPVSFHTADQALFQHGELQPGQTGQTVLIHAAAGGVGSIAVQLAHQAGVTVLATASANNHDYVRALGADQVVDYHDEDFAAQFEFTGKRSVDLVLAPFAGRSLQGSAELVDANTRIVLLSPVATEADMKIGPVESQVMIVQADGAALEKVAERFVSGELQAEIAQVFPFAQIKQAHQLSETEHARGKIVLKITE